MKIPVFSTGGQPVSPAAVILNGLCALIWTARFVLELVTRGYNESWFWFSLNALCAVMWILAFVAMLQRYRTEKKDTGEKSE